MCGILSLIKLNDKEDLDCDNFKESLELMAHRGPDAMSCSYEENVFLGHARLSIIDVNESANQPLYSICGKYSIVFNGEIYNYKELKPTLIELGYQFKTKSDSEVLLYLLVEYREKALEMLIGMFSFVFCDLENDEFIIARDRLGIKPLFYRDTGDTISISSEVRPLVNLDRNVTLNKESIYSYFAYRYPVLGGTFFKEIQSFPAASILKISNGTMTFSKYWELNDAISNNQEDLGESYYIRKLKELLESATVYRMESDVEIGSFLSGGVDSSAITALMAKHSNTPVRTFTIGFDEKNYQEFEYANEVSKQYSTQHKEITVSGVNYIDSMAELIALKGAPLSVPNEVALYLMAKEMKKSVSVVLSGEGADEIFAGYGRIHRSTYDYERVIELLNKEKLSSEEKDFLDNCKMLYGENLFSTEVEHFRLKYEYMTQSERQKLFKDKKLLGQTEEKIHRCISSAFEEANSDNYLDKMLYVFETIHLQGLLSRVDNATMAASIEARVPFVDHRLVEFAFSIPNKYKLKWNDQRGSKYLISDDISEKYDTPKYILKKALEGTLSDNILYRKKMGFPVPLDKWFGGEFRKYATNILLSEDSKILDIVNENEIVNLINNEDLHSNHKSAMKVWNLINVELFIRTFF